MLSSAAHAAQGVARNQKLLVDALEYDMKHGTNTAFKYMPKAATQAAQEVREAVAAVPHYAYVPVAVHAPLKIPAAVAGNNKKLIAATKKDRVTQRVRAAAAIAAHLDGQLDGKKAAVVDKATGDDLVAAFLAKARNAAVATEKATGKTSQSMLKEIKQLLVDPKKVATLTAAAPAAKPSAKRVVRRARKVLKRARKALKQAKQSGQTTKVVAARQAVQQAKQVLAQAQAMRAAEARAPRRGLGHVTANKAHVELQRAATFENKAAAALAEHKAHKARAAHLRRRAAERLRHAVRAGVGCSSNLFGPVI